MLVSEQHRKVEIAVELDDAARALAHSTRDVPNPIDSYWLLAELGPTVDHLQQIVRQLSAWHRSVNNGREHPGDGVTGTLEVAEEPGEGPEVSDVIETRGRTGTPSQMQAADTTSLLLQTQRCPTLQPRQRLQ